MSPGNHQTTAVPRWYARAALCVAVGILAGAWLTFAGRTSPNLITDFDQTWQAARLMLSGADPYTVIGDGSDPRWRFRYYYPAPATLVAVPLANLSLEQARALFVGVSGALFTWALTRRRWLPTVGLLTQSYFSAVLLAQWTPLLAATVALPWVGWSLAAKPNVGVLVATIFDDRRAAWRAGLCALALVALSFLADPTWVPRWRAALETSEHFRPFVLRPGGAILLLVLLRWRRPEARLLAALTILPYTPATRETLLFFLTPLSRPAIAVLLVGPYVVARLMLSEPAGGNFVDHTNASARWILLFVYLPLAAAILATPNVGHAPAFIERVVRRFPAFLRGTGDSEVRQ